MVGLGLKSHLFTAGSQDVNNRFVASQLLYGSAFALPVPDVLRTDLLVVIGANPIVSHGSVLTAPRIRDRMHDIVKRGGRVLVIDPRKTETAAQFEWLGIVPDGDAYLLLSLLQVMLAENLADRAAIAGRADGLEWLERLAAPFTPEATEQHTGIAPDTVRGLARDLVRTPRAAVYGRVGTSVGRNGTLTTLSARRGQPGRGQSRPGRRHDVRHLRPARGALADEGGRRHASPAVPAQALADRRLPVGAALRARRHHGQGDHHPGPGQVRALFVSAGNPVLSVPNGAELEGALDSLELSVGIDLYLNETTGRCDYVLPATTMYERDDFPLPFQVLQPPVPPGHRGRRGSGGTGPPGWAIIDELTRRLAHRTLALRGLDLTRKGVGRLRFRLTPRAVADAVIRLSTGGDRFGLRPAA